MMYNWPPNTRAQQTHSGWCNSTLPLTYHPSRSSLFLLYGYGSRPTDSPDDVPSFPLTLALKYSSQKAELYFPDFLFSKEYLLNWLSLFENMSSMASVCLGLFWTPNCKPTKIILVYKKYQNIKKKRIRSAAWNKKRQIWDGRQIKFNIVTAQYRARCVEVCWWEF